MSQLMQTGGGGSSTPTGSANLVEATPNGSSGSASLRALVVQDLPIPSLAGDGAYMWTMDCDDGSIGATATAIAPTGSNNVLVFKFVCRKTIVIRKIVFMNGSTVTASATANFGIYDASGNLLIDSGVFSTSTVSQTLSNTLTTPVTLYANTTYWFAQACTNGTNTAAGNGPATMSNAVVPVTRNKNVVRQGLAANAYSAGALPPTLGVVTGFVNRNPVAVLFES